MKKITPWTAKKTPTADTEEENSQRRLTNKK
jgi:hypothetical protein